VDLADQRVAEARRYVPGGEFTVGSVFDPGIRQRFEDFDVFVVLEILEHLEQDTELLAAIPQGATVILSVPNYDSEAHVRFFADADAVVERYGALLDFEAGEGHVCERRQTLLSRLRGRKRHRIFVFAAVRRSS
jgi:2-polyprenyl-3-methyl-5-hydroxy-6-metoxy-1,4-benzoquinol methylase